MGVTEAREKSLGALRAWVAAAVAVALLFALPSGSQAAGAKLVKWGDFSAPVAVVQPPGAAGEVWVVQKRGQIIVVRNGRPISTKALDVVPLVSYGIEQGLLGLAFAPDFATSRLAYVTWTDKANSLVLAEYRANGSLLDPASKRVLMTIAKPFDNHNAGTIRFGADGMLYLSVGDGGTGLAVGTGADLYDNAQNLGSLLGKILRIDPRRSGDDPYSIPAGNPFIGTAGARPEIWSYGLRNPWKWSFGPDGAMWIGDVGLQVYEEVNRATGPGHNFGWRILEGLRVREPARVTSGLTPAVYTYKHGSTTGCSVTGGVVVTDPTLPTTIRGRYLFSDFCQPTLRTLTTGTRPSIGSTGLRVSGGMVVSIDADLAGRIYITTLGGRIWRLMKS